MDRVYWYNDKNNNNGKNSDDNNNNDNNANILKYWECNNVLNQNAGVSLIEYLKKN